MASCLSSSITVETPLYFIARNDLFHPRNALRPRWFVQTLESALKVLPVTVVTGARQTTAGARAISCLPGPPTCF
jgi:hypothetical protein